MECGWGFSAVLTKGGDVYVWWPLNGVFWNATSLHNEERDGDPSARVQAQDGAVHCQTWEVSADPSLIQSVAVALPKLREDDVGERIVKIAAGDNFVIGLTDGGHVLKVNFFEGHRSFDNSLRRPRWQYVCTFLLSRIFSNT